MHVQRGLYRLHAATQPLTVQQQPLLEVPCWEPFWRVCTNNTYLHPPRCDNLPDISQPGLQVCVVRNAPPPALEDPGIHGIKAAHCWEQPQVCFCEPGRHRAEGGPILVQKVLRILQHAVEQVSLGNI